MRWCVHLHPQRSLISWYHGWQWARRTVHCESTPYYFFVFISMIGLFVVCVLKKVVVPHVNDLGYKERAPVFIFSFFFFLGLLTFENSFECWWTPTFQFYYSNPAFLDRRYTQTERERERDTHTHTQDWWASLNTRFFFLRHESKKSTRIDATVQEKEVPRDCNGRKPCKRPIAAPAQKKKEEPVRVSIHMERKRETRNCGPEACSGYLCC